MNLCDRIQVLNYGRTHRRGRSGGGPLRPGRHRRLPRPGPTVLELTDVHVRYGNIRALQGVSLRVDDGRARRADRLQRRRQDARRCGRSRACSGRRRARSRSRAPTSPRAPTDRIVALGISHCPGGSPDLRQPDRRARTSAWARCRGRDAAAAAAEDLEMVFALFPLLEGSGSGRPAGRCPAASSRCWRSGGRS